MINHDHALLDYDAIPASLAAQAVKPGDPGYDSARSTYAWPGAPGLVLRPKSAQQVAEALAFARTQNVPLAVRSGGHGTSGRATNDGGIVIDLGALNRIEVIDRERALVRVGPGARWGEVAQALAPYGLAISSGDHGGVGVGGVTTIGGQGFLARSYGLTIDHVVGAEVVLADGRIVRADADRHPDLFWALRGAGANMGIVTSVELEAAEVGDVVYALFVHDASDIADFLQKWGRLVEDSPPELTAFVTVFPQGRAAVAQTQVIWAGDDTNVAVTALRPFVRLAPILQQQAQLVPYAAVMPPVHEGHYGQAHMRTRSALLDHLDAPTATTIGRLLSDQDIHMLQIRSVGAAVNATPADATAYAHRTQNFALSATINESRRAHAEQTWTQLHSDAIYLGFETHGDATSLAKAYPPTTLARLRAVKAAYDPDNILHTSFPIPPAQPLPHTAGSKDRSVHGHPRPQRDHCGAPVSRVTELQPVEARAADPDTARMRGLYDEYAAALWRYALRLTGDRARAEDVVQETLLRAWQHPEIIHDSERSVRAWLFTVARNMIIDERRSSRFRNELSSLDGQGATERAGPDEVDAALNRLLIGDALAQLSPEHRAVIRRSYYLGWTTAQIADDLQIAEGTVKSRLHHALRALRLTLREMGVGD
ncbi:MAG: hypothetical protein QOK33_4558 [Mycobacterium sp.]|nr:hypothetical protein [Mycobacterium sp.]